MPSTVVNFITTTLLTVFASVTLLVTYRYAVRPILVRNNMLIPLQHIPSTIAQHLQNRRGRRGHIRLPSEDYDDDPEEYADGQLTRDLEDGFGVYRDSDDEEDGDRRVRPKKYTDEEQGTEMGTPASAAAAATERETVLQ
ncbi:hypothetical protein FPQ18DRAFT_336380 [Pyronema domesticum]|uniref:Uncharacterized protein n=1 Tax=Pyronema omphalodes (strain CBS 100304) TaxID=1076935 RepID=U4L8X6_PYROM|nr:hypothetical protein FPQ18DRAFT_336380 [Pyronema domesticum]CCX06574.1 Similar to hypothetical protein [Tuber melanosporum Mel28]; acc. no. XP_002838273 [Pyronema omphalodes CBS 100304]